MARFLRGGVYWADLEPARGHEQRGQRPVVILSHDLFNDKAQTVVAMALTSQPQRPGHPLTWKLTSPVAGKDAWVKLSQIRTLAAERLGRRVALLDAADVGRLVDACTNLSAKAARLQPVHPVTVLP